MVAAHGVGQTSSLRFAVVPVAALTQQHQPGETNGSTVMLSTDDAARTSAPVIRSASASQVPAETDGSTTASFTILPAR